ncbi:MAG TPA: putative nitrogen fixation protein NifT [Acidiferrobacter sp.]|nr:putative nitrogen fixation protein NifT [Acidiferrobacter sp.]
MKIMIRKGKDGVVTVYVPKKDLEEPVVDMERPTMWGGRVTLGNGWQLDLPMLAADTALPITVDARRIGEA